MLGTFPEAISEGARARLESLGVRVRVGERVTSAMEEGLVLTSDEIIPDAIRVWAAGVKAPDFLGNLIDLEKNPNNQLIVTPTRQTVSDPAVFAIGDCASLSAVRPAAAQLPRNLLQRAPAT